MLNKSRAVLALLSRHTEGAGAAAAGAGSDGVDVHVHVDAHCMHVCHPRNIRAAGIDRWSHHCCLPHTPCPGCPPPALPPLLMLGNPKHPLAVPPGQDAGRSHALTRSPCMTHRPRYGCWAREADRRRHWRRRRRHRYNPTLRSAALQAAASPSPAWEGAFRQSDSTLSQRRRLVLQWTHFGGRKRLTSAARG